MRIIAGEWRGRRIDAPKGDAVRPTLDRVREAWMNILQLDMPGARVLDLYAGSGALGLEALSRGAEFVSFVDSDRKSVAMIVKNAAKLGAGERCAIHLGDALEFAARSQPRPDQADGFDIAFADPPYRKQAAHALALLWLKAPFSTIFGVEHESSESMPGNGDTRKYGDSSITIYRSAGNH
jgi:16S rRNA (guanine966-N2)-methyltransferase